LQTLPLQQSHDATHVLRVFAGTNEKRIGRFYYNQIGNSHRGNQF
jgi:hypothetical protein